MNFVIPFSTHSTQEGLVSYPPDDWWLIPTKLWSSNLLILKKYTHRSTLSGEFYDKFLASDFALSDKKDNTWRLLNRACLPNNKRLTSAENARENAFRCNESQVSKLSDSLENPFISIKCRIGSFFWYKHKRFLWATAAAEASQNHEGDVMKDTLTNSNLNSLSKFLSSRNNQMKDAFPRNLTGMIIKTISLCRVNKYSCSGPPAFKSGSCRLRFS